MTLMGNLASPLALLLCAAALSAQAAPAKPILSRVQIHKLQGLMADHGHDSHVDPVVAKALGLTKGKKPLILRQLTVRENEQLTHAFEQITGDGGLILGVAGPDGVKVYRTNARQELVAAVLETPNAPPAAILHEEAQKELKVELAYWGAIANQD
jgi:hypothetical protein